MIEAKYLVTNNAFVLRCKMVHITARIELTNGSDIQLGIFGILDDCYFSSIAIPIQSAWKRHSWEQNDVNVLLTIRLVVPVDW